MRRNTRRAAIAAKRAIPDFTPDQLSDLALCLRMGGEDFDLPAVHTHQAPQDHQLQDQQPQRSAS